MKQDAYLKEIDVLKAFAIIGVISIHVSGNFTVMKSVNSLTYINMVVDFFSQFAVPLFILLSGFTLSMKYYTKLDIKHFYIKRFKTILPLYILFTIAYSLYFDVYDFKTILLNLLTTKASYHLWFVLLIAQFYLIYPLILRLHKTKSMSLLTISFIVQVFWKYLIAIKIVSGLLSFCFAGWLLYFVLGIYLSQHRGKTQAFITNISFVKLILISVGFNAIISGYYIASINKYATFQLVPTPSYFIVLNTLSFLVTFALLYKISLKLTSKLLLSIGKLSYEIYLFHIFPLSLTASFLYYKANTTVDSWLFYPVCFMSSLFFSVLFAKTISLIKSYPRQKASIQGYFLH